MFLTKLILILTLILAIIFMGTHICAKDTAIYVQAVYCEDCERWLSNYHQWTKYLTRYKHRKNTDPNFVQSMKQYLSQNGYGYVNIHTWLITIPLLILMGDTKTKVWKLHPRFPCDAFFHIYI